MILDIAWFQYKCSKINSNPFNSTYITIKSCQNSNLDPLGLNQGRWRKKIFWKNTKKVVNFFIVNNKNKASWKRSVNPWHLVFSLKLLLWCTWQKNKYARARRNKKLEHFCNRILHDIYIPVYNHTPQIQKTDKKWSNFLFRRALATKFLWQVPHDMCFQNNTKYRG